MLGLMAKKVGMTQVFDNDGNLTPVTVLKVDPNIVIAQKTEEKYGYSAVVLGVDDMKKSRVTKPYAGQFPEGMNPKKKIREFRDFEKECAVGDSLGAELFEGCRYVDVTGISKGKGFQGVMKRWGFGGGRNTHGSKFHREPGSTGQCTSPGHSFKNVKMPGRMGRERVTVLNLKVVKVDVDNQLIMVRGAVPGVNKGTVVVRAAVKK
ncbi:MAG TPA: 50S ribosomal protein L3 [Treponema sp.]|jgi:large subunit ribosomal protein L3|nr:50S ribosomal protein L3 [Treponema sp.]HPC70548.1 50S ribosomal protein L3 [Treponema sp.]HRS03773.1 50S ribosomal protein L3 [Treponema sp.]HRU28168.1 50S ribosomal protein L3 [Treponema sp.]